MNKVKVRFAPSPTGFMHLGNIRVAVFNFLFSQLNSGIFFLRIEDTDFFRNCPDSYNFLLKDLLWLGILFDNKVFVQSSRKKLYDYYFDILCKKGFVYKCFCSEKKSFYYNKSRNINLLSYDKCLDFNINDINEKIDSGIKPVFKFKVLKDKNIFFKDLIRGEFNFNSKLINNFVIKRSNLNYSFLFCNVIDDIDMNITHIIRGEDHLSNTPKQIMILNSLNFKIPYYLHLPMICDINGNLLSKRKEDFSLYKLKKEGFSPLAILNYISRLGHDYKKLNFLSVKYLCKYFNIKNISSSSSKYDLNQLRFWQRKFISYITIFKFNNLLTFFLNKTFLYNQVYRLNFLIHENLLFFSDIFSIIHILYDLNFYYFENLFFLIKKYSIYFIFCFMYFFLLNLNLNFYLFVNLLFRYLSISKKLIYIVLRVILTNSLHGFELLKIFNLVNKHIIFLRFRKILFIMKRIYV